MRGRVLVRKSEILVNDELYTITIDREDFSDLYPDMARYDLGAWKENKRFAWFATNNYEYSPGCPLDAHSSAVREAENWEKELATDGPGFVTRHKEHPRADSMYPQADVVIIQGSPRGDGNCSIFAGLADEICRDSGRSTMVIYPHDLLIGPCIGCYQCYNTGHCPQYDDMEGIIHAILSASMVIVCSPVYTETVPGSLKLLIDRSIAGHAFRALNGGRNDQKGVLLAVAGRTGAPNFRCLSRVVRAFFHNLGIIPSGKLCLDRMDEIHDVRNITGVREQVRSVICGNI